MIKYDLVNCRTSKELADALGQHAFHHESAAVNVGVLYGLLSAATRGDELRSAVNEVLRLAE